MRTTLSILALLALVAGTAFGGATTDRLEFSFPMYDSCNDETVNISGIYHFVLSSKDNPDGSTTSRFMINAKGTGVGADSGTQYEFNDTVKQVVTDVGPVRFGTQTRKIRLISRGSNQNLIADFTFSIDEAGNVTDITFTKCRGAS